VPRVPRSTTTAARLLIGGSLLVVALPLLTGCGTPPELREPHAAPSSPPASPTPTGTPTGMATRPPLSPGPTTTPSSNEFAAVPCQGRPSGAQVIALLHRSPGMLAADARVTVSAGPLCAGDWQYTVIQVPKLDPLQVVSKGPASALTLVTAGTDVCSIPVRTEAPPGIQTVACTEGLPPTPGA
jgi:hypothetical protein